MFRKLVCCSLALATQPAWAQDSSVGTDAPGSPTNGTATTSPSSVAQAFDTQTAAGSNFDISLGTSLASGHFGAPTRSSILATAPGVRYAIGSLRLTGSIPYMRIRTAGTILTGIDSTPVLVSRATTSRRMTYDGIGDLTLGASYALPSNPGGLDVEFSGRVKLPTAKDSTQLSSGKTDYSVGVQVGKTIGAVAPFVSATYRIFGDSNRLHLRDGFAGSVGASFITTENLVLLASYHYAERATDLVKDSHELFAGASMLLPGNQFRLTAFATKGLSHGAAGVSGGLGIALSL